MEKKKLWLRTKMPTNEALVLELGREIIATKYGNLFQMYEKIVDENPYETPMMIYPCGALHNGRRLG